jgi:hypothetical protein
LCERVGNSHKFVNDDERDAKPSTKDKDLLANGIPEGGRALGVFVENLSHGSVSEHVACAFDKVPVHVTNEADWNFYNMK